MSKRDQNGEWTRFHNEKLYSSYRSPRVRVIKSRRLKQISLEGVTGIVNGRLLGLNQDY